MQKKPKEEKAAEDSLSFEESLKAWLSSEFFTKYGKKAGIIFLIIALGISIVIFQRKNFRQKTYTLNKQLGPAYVYYSRNQLDSAEIFLKSFLSSPHKQMVESKANLLLGNAQYSQNKYQEAIESYQKVKGSPENQSLLTSGALHGLAACHIQLKEYQKAVELLETFISTYMKRTGGLGSRNMKKEPQDLSPAVPNALWKLALCYKQINQLEKAKSTCQKIIKVYNHTEEASKAERFLLTL